MVALHFSYCDVSVIRHKMSAIKDNTVSEWTLDAWKMDSVPFCINKDLHTVYNIQRHM